MTDCSADTASLDALLEAFQGAVSGAGRHWDREHAHLVRLIEDAEGRPQPQSMDGTDDYFASESF